MIQLSSWAGDSVAASSYRQVVKRFNGDLLFHFFSVEKIGAGIDDVMALVSVLLSQQYTLAAVSG